MSACRWALAGALIAALAGAAEPCRVALLESPALWARPLSERLAKRGFQVDTVTFAQLTNSQAFSAAAFGCLIVPDSPRVPAAACPAILAFVKKGGDLVLLGGRAFAESGAGVDESLLREVFDDYDVYRLRGVCAVRAYASEHTEGRGGRQGGRLANAEGLAGVTAASPSAAREDARPPLQGDAGTDEPRAGGPGSVPAAETVDDVLVRGSFTGWSALGFPALGDATYMPLLAAEDRYGRRRGWAAGALIHHAGAFEGSQWLLAGVNEPAFYEAPAVQALIAAALAAFRDGAWLERSRARCEGAYKKVLSPASSAAAPQPLRIENGHFVRADGSRFFALGANFFNSFHTYYGGTRMWSLAELERDFQRMRRAGVNAVRLHDAQRFLTEGRTEAFLGLCRQYGVYILPTAAAAHSGKALEQLAAEARRKAALLKSEPMMIGYDLDNEPYWWELSRLTQQGQKLSDRHPVPKDAWKPYQRSLNLAPADWTTTFPGLSRLLPEPQDEAWRQAYRSVNAVYGDWIEALSAGLRAEDKAHPLSVGYNTVYACLPVNARLDFVAHHVYEPPDDLEHVKINVTTLDRLRQIWPGKPVLLGEFGYSNGDRVNGTFLDVYSSSIGEFVHYLHALAGGFDGVLKWELCDADPAYQWRWLTWLREAPVEKRLQQRRFGMFVYDGTPEGRAKPIAHATRFLRDYLDTHALQGTLTLRSADYPTGTAYTFTADHALFIGDRRFESDGLRFESADPAHVLLTWDERELRLLATADARVELRPSRFVKGLTPDARVAGAHGEAAKASEPDWLTVTALEGEPLTLSQ